MPEWKEIPMVVIKLVFICCHHAVNINIFWFDILLWRCKGFPSSMDYKPTGVCWLQTHWNKLFRRNITIYVDLPWVDIFSCCKRDDHRLYVTFVACCRPTSSALCTVSYFADKHFTHKTCNQSIQYMSSLDQSKCSTAHTYIHLYTNRSLQSDILHLYTHIHPYLAREHIY